MPRRDAVTRPARPATRTRKEPDPCWCSHVNATRSIMIGDEIELTVVDIRGDKVRLGNQGACRMCAVHRKEVYEAIKRENEQAASLREGESRSPETQSRAVSVRTPQAPGAPLPAAKLRLNANARIDPIGKVRELTSSRRRAKARLINLSDAGSRIARHDGSSGSRLSVHLAAQSRRIAMARINTNISSIVAQTQSCAIQLKDLRTSSLQRLSTGLRINRDRRRPGRVSSSPSDCAAR